jgi:hypothetical protein
MWSFVGNAKEKVWVSFKIGIHARFWELPLGSEMQREHEPYGTHCLPCIVNVQFVTRISGRLTRKYFPVKGIKLSGRRQA